MEYALPAGVSASLSYQYERQFISSNQQADIESYYTRNLINTFYQPGATRPYPVPLGGILHIKDKNNTIQNLRFQISLNNRWNQHQISAIVGSEVRQVINFSNNSSVFGFDPSNFLATKVDQVNTYRSFVTGSPVVVPATSGMSETTNRYVSFYGNAAYTFHSKYTASVSARKDASNMFGININDRWNPLWSGGVAWNLSEERFFNLGFIDHLKVRMTYGVSGNIDPTMSAVTTMNYTGTSMFTGTPMATIRQFYNPDLGWEKSYQFNAGIDFRSKHNRIGGSIEYYIKKGTDLYGPSALDLTTGLGVQYITKNAAKMIAQGVDIELRSTNLKRVVEWTSTLNMNLYRDKITEYYLVNESAGSMLSDGITILGLEGKPVHSVMSYRWGGLDPETGNPLGFIEGKESQNYSLLTGSGTTISDLVYSGPALPTLFGSLNNNIAYRQFSLAVSVGYKCGHYFKKVAFRYGDLYRLSSTDDYERRWQKPRDELITDVPSMVYPAVTARDNFYSEAEVHVLRGDHIRLNFITLGYDFRLRHRQYASSPSLRFYINANDLGILWKANNAGIDPAYRSNSIPQGKTFAFGLLLSY